ncbi:SWI/SNF-related matrix-associated actin-dependent regulator of chromatin subfamily A-like protein 1 [Mactra antiquata]
MSSDLTVEQQKRIEENRRKALALRQKKLQTSLSTIKTANIGCSKISNVGTNILSGPFHDSNKSKTQSNAVRQNSVAVSNVNKSNYQADYKPSQSTVLSVTSSTSGCSNSVNFNKPSLSNDNSLTKTSGSSNIDFDRIEQNRLKALSRRAEKLCKSPERSVKQSENMGGIPVSTTNSSWQYTASNSSSITSSKPEQSSISNVNFDKSVPAKNQSMSMNTTKQPSFTGQNIFSGFPGTPVKGGCYLISKDRFTVKAGYSEPLIQLFKAMDTKLYDAVTKKWSFKLLEYNKFMSSVVNLRPSVTIEPLPPAILKIFSTHIKGGNSSKTVPMADLSKVEPSLVNSLMSFQREGVK